MRRALVPALVLILAIAAAALIRLFGSAQPDTAAPAPPRPVVTEIVAESAPVAARRSIPGVIAAAAEVQMAFQTLGRLIERPVDLGDRVAAGDLLARLDPEDLASATRSAEAALASAEVELTTAENTAGRARALLDRDVTSAAQMERAEQALLAAQSSVEQARARLESARDAEGRAVMTAPMAGVVSALRATPGAVVAAGDPILTLSSEQDLEARIDLTEAELAGVAPGTEFLVWRERDGGREPVRAGVDRVSPVADAQTRTRRVHIGLPPDTGGLRLGSLIRASRADARSAQLTVPATAILDRPEGPAVWIVRREGRAATVALQPVATGARLGDRVEVTQGLEPGTEVVIRGVRSLADGQPVGRGVAP